MPAFYPPPYYDFSSKSEESFLQERLFFDKSAERVAKRLDLAAWVSINQLINLPIESWIGQDDWSKQYGLHPLIKRAISLEVDRLSSELKSARAQAEHKLEMEKQELRKNFDYGKPNSSFNRLFQ